MMNAALITRERIIGANIRRLRKQKGLKQKDLSAQTKIAQANLSKIERGKQMPRPSTLRIIARILGVQPYQLEETTRDEMLVVREETNEYHLLKQLETYDVIRPSLDVTILVNPDTPLKKRTIIIEYAILMREKLKDEEK
jgi:transcriptional regulator with XRE-family HTH domain